MPFVSDEDLSVVPARPSPDQLAMSLRQLDRQVVRVTTWAASVFALVLIVIGLIGGDNTMLIMSINPSAIALVGWFMLERDNPVAALQLVVGMVGTGLVVVTVQGDLHDDAIFALLAMGVAGAIFTRRHVELLIGFTMTGIGVLAYLHEQDLTSTLRIQTAFGAAGTYLFLALLVVWLRRHWVGSQVALQELIRSKDELVASVSHELRTPMTTVVGLSRELDERYAEFTPSEIAEFVSLMVQESTDVANILEDLLVAARADVGTLSLDMRPIDLGDQLRTVLATMPPGSVGSVGDCEELPVVADAGRVRQILRNLVVNAHRYGGPTVRVVVERKNRSVFTTVHDDGPPIPDSDRGRIFEPYQGLHGVSGLPGSVGLGLTVSRELARLMGGDLAYSHDGKEAAFTFVMPLSELPTRAPSDGLEVTPIAM